MPTVMPAMETPPTCLGPALHIRPRGRTTVRALDRKPLDGALAYWRSPSTEGGTSCRLANGGYKGDYRPPFNPPPLRVRVLMVERRSLYYQRLRGSGIP